MKIDPHYQRLKFRPYGLSTLRARSRRSAVKIDDSLNDDDCSCRLHATSRVAWWTCVGHGRHSPRLSNKSKWTQNAELDQDDDIVAADPMAWSVVTGFGSDRCVTFRRDYRNFCPWNPSQAQRQRRATPCDDSSTAAARPFSPTSVKSDRRKIQRIYVTVAFNCRRRWLCVAVAHTLLMLRYVTSIVCIHFVNCANPTQNQPSY